MYWSEILTQGEGDYMQDLLVRLRSTPWAGQLLTRIDQQGGITYANKPLLFEARVGHALDLAGANPVEYEYSAGVGDSTVDFRFATRKVWLAEVVSIGRSKAVEAATFHSGPFYGTSLSSPHPSKSTDERRQSEEGESLLVIQKIGEKVYDGKAKTPIKFPEPIADQYHVVIVDMRGHMLGAGDIADWMQIAYGAETVAPELRKTWLSDDNETIPLRDVWHPENTLRFAATARERLHAIMFVAEKNYRDGALPEGAWVACNPHLFHDETTASAVLAHFPLWSGKSGAGR